MIVCEIGLNHMGILQYANEYVDRIIKAKADGIIFHMREKSFYESKRNYKLNLPDDFYIRISKKIKKNNLKFGISIADPEKIDFCEKIGVDFYKVFSIDIGNKDLIKKIIKTKKPTFISTGISDFDEIEKLVKLIKNYKTRFTLIQTQLDNDTSLTNLKSILILKKKFKINVAYGNHAKNTNVLYVALAFEPSDFLFYVKGTKIKRHIDESHAIQLDNLNNIIQNLRDLSRSLGTGIKVKTKPNAI